MSFATSKTKMIRVLVQRGNSLQLRSSLVRFGTACCPKGAQHSKTCRFRRVPRFTVVGTRSIIGVLKVVSCFFKFDFLPCIDTFNKVLVKNMVRLWWFLLPNPSRGLRCPREWVVMIAVKALKVKNSQFCHWFVGFFFYSHFKITHKTYWRTCANIQAAPVSWALSSYATNSAVSIQIEKMSSQSWRIMCLRQGQKPHWNFKCNASLKHLIVKR